MGRFSRNNNNNYPAAPPPAYTQEKHREFMKTSVPKWDVISTSCLLTHADQHHHNHNHGNQYAGARAQQPRFILQPVL